VDGSAANGSEDLSERLAPGGERTATTVRELVAPERLALDRGQAAVCVPVHGAYDLFVQCIRAILVHTPTDVPILVADDGSPDPAVRAFLDEAGQAYPRHQLVYTREPECRGFVATANHVFELLAPADVVLVNSDCVVTERWLEGLRAAAYSDTRVATASALTNSGTILSVPHRNRPSPLPQDWQIDDAAAAVRAASLGLHPEIPTAIAHCVYVRRSAIDAVGDFDEAFSPGYEEEVDFSQRCVRMGFSHVAADDVFVLHYGGGSFSGAGASAIRTEHHRIIEARYPYYDGWVAEVADDRRIPLARTVRAAARAMRGMSVTVDGRILTEFITGTQVHTLELITALHRLDRVKLRVITPPDLGEYARRVFANLGGIELVDEADLDAAERTDVVHRPYQVSGPDDLALLERAGDRLVITHQDLIAFNIPAYFRSLGEWRTYRRLTRTALALADQVVFFSEHARGEAVAAELVDQARAHVALLGTDHQLTDLRPEPSAPRGSERIGDERPFLLCLGTDFMHKNRPFALRLLAALRERHEWNGMLVFAGAHVTAGSSAGQEAAFLAANPTLSDHVVDLVAVDEAGKEWLLRRAAGVVYPTVYEGFGLVPFEASQANLPCFFAPGTSLKELFPEHLGRLVPWNADESADRVIEVLGDERVRQELVGGIAAVGARLSWSHTASHLLDVYQRAVSTPATTAAPLAAEHMSLQAELLAEREDRMATRAAHDRVAAELSAELAKYDPIDAGLVGPRSLVPYHLRRALVGIAYRKWLRVPIFGTLNAAYSLAYFLRHRRRPPAMEDRAR
jgi:GT2 family glycosyltransferase